MKVTRLASFAFLPSLLACSCGLPLGMPGKEIPPELAREMAELEKVLIAGPGDPAALFSLAMDNAAIGDRTKAIRNTLTRGIAQTLGITGECDGPLSQNGLLR